jgi:hypothetical protein
LIESKAQGNENFEIEFGERLRGSGCDIGVEARAPAEYPHDEFGGQGMIWSGEAIMGSGVEKFGGIGRFAFDAEEDVEGGGTGG